jgi:hypothetical protein
MSYHGAKSGVNLMADYPQVDITKDDSSSPEQLREAFRGMAMDKVSSCDSGNWVTAELYIAICYGYRLPAGDSALRDD